MMESREKNISNEHFQFQKRLNMHALEDQPWKAGLPRGFFLMKNCPGVVITNIGS